MKVLILGGSGMLGHKLWQVLASRFESYVTFRGSFDMYRHYNLFDPIRVVEWVSAESFESVVRAIEIIQPAVVINCIGVIKQVPDAQDPLVSIPINALFPHRLAQECHKTGIRLIHFSTDCVFSGRKGRYTEDDLPDPNDLYGRTKLLGEVVADGCITLRTSIIGRELASAQGLFEWFFRQRGKTVNGYARAIYSGFPTIILAELIGDIIEKYPTLSGLWHVSSEPISKYALLFLIKEIFKLDIRIVKDSTFFCDRSLDSSRFREMAGYEPPPWPDMIAKMAADAVMYARFTHHEGVE